MQCGWLRVTIIPSFSIDLPHPEKLRKKVWDIAKEDGARVSSFKELPKEVESYFFTLYNDL